MKSRHPCSSRGVFRRRSIGGARCGCPATAARNRRLTREARGTARQALVWGHWCQVYLGSISLFDPARHLLVPTWTLTWPPRAVTVKGGRRPSRSDLPLTVASTAAGSLVGLPSCSADERRQFRGELAISARRSRHNLVFGRSVRIGTMMQSYASAAKLRGGGPILHSGLEAMCLASGHRHLGSSSADPRHGLPSWLSCCPPLRAVAHDAGRKTTPSGTSPVVTRRQSAMSSLRASATIIVLRVLLRPSAVRA